MVITSPAPGKRAKANKKAVLPAIFLLLGGVLSAQEWNPDVSGTTVVLERFFFNGKENTANLQRIWFDEDQNPLLSAFLRSDGSERSRKVYRYDGYGELTEYSVWDASGDGFSRWYHQTRVRSEEDGLIIYTTTTQRYREAPYVSRVEKMREDGTPVSSEYLGLDSSTDYREYDQRGNLIYTRYENEKSDGQVEIRYDIQYGDDGNPAVVTARDAAGEDGRIISISRRSYDSRGRLISEDITYADTGKRRLREYSWEGDRQSEMRVIDPESGETLARYYTDYDSRGWKLKWGEELPDYQRYWIYEKE